MSYPRNRRLNSNSLLFYAPLTESIYPTIAWDGKKNFLHSTISGIDPVEKAFKVVSGSWNGLYFDSVVPLLIPRNLFFSCWVNPTYNQFYNTMFGYSFGITDTQIGRSCHFALNGNINKNFFYIQDIATFNSFFPDFPLVAPENQWTFITWNLSYEPEINAFYFRVFANGILVTTPMVTDGIFAIKNNNYFKPFVGFGDMGYLPNNIDLTFAIGGLFSSFNVIGFYKHYSCYHNLTDDQVLELYNNGGVPY